MRCTNWNNASPTSARIWIRENWLLNLSARELRKMPLRKRREPKKISDRAI